MFFFYFFSYWVAWVSYIYLDTKPFPNMWFANIFFHSIGFHFILLMAFFYYAECFEFDVVSLVYFCSSCLCVWWLSCLSCLYFGKQSFISCFICYYLLQFLPKDTDWLNGYKNKTQIYAFYKRPTSVLETHTDWKWVDGKRYSMQMEIKRKPYWQFSYRREEGGGFRMGNTCKPVADSFWYLANLIQLCKV